MKKFLFSLAVLFFSFSSFAQEVMNSVVLRYDVSVELDVFRDLDKRKLTRSKDKTLYNNIIADQLGLYRTKTYDSFYDILAQKEGIEIADRDALEGLVPYDEGVPIPLFPKKVLKKSCQGVAQDYFVITNVSVKKPVIKLVSNLLGIHTTIKILNKSGELVKEHKYTLEMDQPIRSRDFEGKFDKLYRAHYDELYQKLEPQILKSIAEAYAGLDLTDMNGF